MVDKELFLSGIQEQVSAYQGAAYVRIVPGIHTDLGPDSLVRDIVRTYDGAVTLNVWLDIRGACPIVAGSSSFYEFDVRPVIDYKTVTIPFEQILTVVVVPAISVDGRFTM